MVQYDNVINRHRRVVYTIRRKILEGADIKAEIERLMEAKVRELTVVPAKNNKNFDVEFDEIFPISDKKLKAIGLEKNDKQRYELALKEVKKTYTAKEEELETDVMRKVEREVYLQVLDTLWMQHLENMQHLREGIHWRSVGQRDPLVEYRSESQSSSIACNKHFVMKYSVRLPTSPSATLLRAPKKTTIPNLPDLQRALSKRV